MIQSTRLRVTKNTFALMFSKGTTLLFSFAFFVYVARFLGVSGLGEYSVVRNYFDLFVSLGATAVGIVITREIAQKPAWANRYVCVSVIFVSILSLAGCCILIFIGFISHYSSTVQMAITIASLAILPASITQVIEAAFVGLEKAEYVTYLAVIENIVRIGLSTAVLYWGFGLISLFVVLLSVRIAVLPLYAFSLKRLLTTLKWDFERASLKKLVMDWKVFAAENWLSNLFGHLDVILLSWFYGEVVVGLFAAATKLLSLGNTVIVSFTAALYPYLSRLYRESKEKFRKVSEALIRYVLIIVFPPAIIVTLLSNQIVSLIFTDRYAGSATILQILVWVLALKFVNLPLSYILFSQGQQKRSLQAATITMAVYLVPGLWFISRWSAIGVAIADVLSLFVAFWFYCLSAFHWRGARILLWVLVRVAFAGCILGFIIQPLNGVIPLVIILTPFAIVLYIVILILTRAITPGEVEQAKITIRQVPYKTNRFLRRLIFREVL